MGKSKGSDFERLLCKRLSEWWTHGKRDDVFWRTSSSGGRATQRAAKGKQTALQQGDVTAVDPLGAPLLACFTLELKRGYGAASPFDLLEANRTKSSVWPLFLEQAVKQQKDAGSEWWAIVFQRDRRKPCIVVPATCWRLLRHSCFEKDLRGDIVEPDHFIYMDNDYAFVICRLDDFLDTVSPEWILKHAEDLK